MKMLIVQNLPYQNMIYNQGVCNATCTSIRLLFKMLDYRFFVFWCTAPMRTSTEVFVRTQAACFTQMPLQSWKHSVNWVTLVWETWMIQPPSLNCIHSGFPIDEKHMGVVRVFYMSARVHSQFTTKQILNMVRDSIT
jgi:hypothetical protein